MAKECMQCCMQNFSIVGVRQNLRVHLPYGLVSKILRDTLCLNDLVILAALCLFEHVILAALCLFDQVILAALYLFQQVIFAEQPELLVKVILCCAERIFVKKGSLLHFVASNE